MAKIKEIVQHQSEENEEVSEEEEIEEGSSEEDGPDEEEESSDEELVEEERAEDLVVDEGTVIRESDDSDDESYKPDEEDEQQEEDIESGDDELAEDPFVVLSSVANNLEPRKLSKNVANVDGDEYRDDSSDEEDIRNTIGNVPVSWYDEYPHVGYDWSGDPIERKGVKANEVDDFMRKVDDPYYWRTVRDNMTGERVVLTDEDASLVQRIKKGKYPDSNYEAYPDFIDFFTYEKMIHPLTNEPERKS